MNTEQFSIDGQGYIWAPEGERCLASDLNITYEGLNDPICMKAPKFWAVTRNNGDLLFILAKTEEDKQKSSNYVVTASDLNKMKIQWFEPLADNYREMLWVNTKEYIQEAYKSFTWQDILDFSLVNRYPQEYRSGKPGDWKQSPQGAAGFILVMVNSKPYWADAVGQIPYAIDTYRFTRSTRVVSTIGMVVAKGKIREDFINLVRGECDFSNEYDNYFVLRGALFARRTFYTSIELVGKFFSTPEITEKMNSIPASELGSPITKEERDEYATWNY